MMTLQIPNRPIRPSRGRRRTGAPVTNKPPSDGNPEVLAATWNEVIPIGTEITRYRLMHPLREPIATKSRSAAWVMGGHTAVVLVEDCAGAIPLAAIVVRSNELSCKLDLKRLHAT